MVANKQAESLPGRYSGQPTASRIVRFLQSPSNRGWLPGLLLVAVTLLAYVPVLPGKFLWDDGSWTSEISWLLRDFTGLRLMWCRPAVLQQYYPLTGTTFWIDYHLWGFWTLPYHVENVLLHALGALLFWRLLRRLQVPGAWLAGAIFALHPVMVESAGWITERKNVLSLVLYLGALHAYGRFSSFWKEDRDFTPSPNNSPLRWGAYSLALLLSLGALLAKTTAFSLPAVILLICWWKRGHVRWRADVLPTLPFFTFAIGLCLVTAWLEKNHVGANGSEWAIPFPERCLIAGRALWFYTSKLLWPRNLCFIYPRWQLDASSLWQWLYPVTAVGTFFVLWFARRRIGRGPAAAAFFFVGTLFPVLGFMNAYFMRYSFVCDHWVYLSSLGLIALAAAGMTSASSFFPRRKVFLESALYGTLLLMLGVSTWRQGLIYKDVEALWRDTLAKNPDAWMAHNDWGIDLASRGQVAAAIAEYTAALRIKPDDDEVHNNLGLALASQGKVSEAIAEYAAALRIKPDYADAHNNLGVALASQGKVSEAIAEFTATLRIKPDYAEVHNNLGIALASQGKVSEAIAEYAAALRIQPDHADAHNNLGIALASQGRISEAIAEFAATLRIKPDYAEVHNNLGVALASQGRISEAIAEYREALRLRPDLVLALSKLAWILATHKNANLRNAGEAVQLAERLRTITGGQQADTLDVLAAAYAGAGRFDDAVQTARKALELAVTAGQEQLAQQIQERLKLYQAGRPYHAGSAPAAPAS